MGSPETDSERVAVSEPVRRMIIPRRFAIATMEVTVEQFRRFVKANSQFKVSEEHENALRTYSPDPDGPWIGASWYTAAAYCNWLSKQEDLPEDQWCYLTQQGRGVRRRDDDPSQRAEAHGLSLADRGGMGICLPSRRWHEPVLWRLGRAAGEVRVVSNQQPGSRLALREPAAQ